MEPAAACGLEGGGSFDQFGEDCDLIEEDFDDAPMLHCEGFDGPPIQVEAQQAKACEKVPYDPFGENADVIEEFDDMLDPDDVSLLGAFTRPPTCDDPLGDEVHEKDEMSENTIFLIGRSCSMPSKRCFVTL